MKKNIDGVYAKALTVLDIDRILRELPKDDLIAYRESLEFYKERLVAQQSEYSVSLKQNELISSSIKGEHKAYNRRG